MTPSLLRSLKTPTICRSCWLGALWVAMGVGGAAHADALTEADVTRLSSLGWDREAIPGGAASPERIDDLFLTVPLDLSSRRRAGVALARAEVASLRSRAARSQSDAVTASLFLFYDALAADREVAIASRAVARLDEAARVMERRQQAGTTSGYERTRLEVEAELARSALRGSEARSKAARAELALLLALDSSALKLQGDLTPAVVVEGSNTAAASRPSVKLLRQSEAEAREARAAGGWSWVPTLSLSGGVRIRETDVTSYGYVAGVSLSLPVFARGQEVIAESAARQRLADVQARAAERATEIEVQRAHRDLIASRAELERFEEATKDRVGLLERAAESGYREGARSIVELVDAQRTGTQVERRRLELQSAVKRAELALRAARGEFE
jgi:outer membrane protein TolC